MHPSRTALTLFLALTLTTAALAAESSLPAALADLPLPENAQVIQAMELPGGGQAILESHTPLGELQSFYKSTLAEEGWTISVELVEDRHVGLVAAKADKQLMVDCSSDRGGKAMISLTITTAE